MAEYERTVLEHYNLPSAFPTEWPSEKDGSDESDDEEDVLKDANAAGGSRSRYSALGRSAYDRKSLVPGAQKTGAGVENLVQKDEPDPLGVGDSVVRILRTQGLPVKDDIRLRNRYLLSSTTFSPTMFLAQVHRSDSTAQLLQGLDILRHSIDQKSASLKVLVESNFERFVRAKATIDNVYTEMKTRGVEPAPAVPARSSRRTSNFRHGSNSTVPQVPAVGAEKKKNALAKESEYGVLGIKAPLIDVAAKTGDFWGPALSGQEKEGNLRVVAAAFEKFRDIYEVPGLIADSIKRKDYDSLAEEHSKARRIADETHGLAEELMSTKTAPSDIEVQQIIIAARMWQDVQEQIEAFKRDIRRRLGAAQPNEPDASGTGKDHHMELISILLELGVEDSPIWDWLLSRFDHLKNKIQSTSERSKVEIEILRRRLANEPRPTSQVLASHLHTLSRQGLEIKSASPDSDDVIELWERIETFLNGMLSSQGILGEILEFWQTAQGFIEGTTQKSFPVGINGASRVHHTLSDECVMQIQTGTVGLFDMISQCVYTFFVDSPIEDISLLYTPAQSTPFTPKHAVSPSATYRDPRFSFNASNAPETPKLNEPWERYGFWPPWSNVLSGAHYLAKLLALVGSSASEMASVSVISSGDNEVRGRLRELVGATRERCVAAICAAWNKDAENIKMLEDWRRSAENKGLTGMPAHFDTFESAVLSGMQKIIYIPDATAKAGSEGIITPPSSKLLQMARSQFVATLYKALSGMVENAEKPVEAPSDEWATDGEALAMPLDGELTGNMSMETRHGTDRNVRMLLTLNNLQALRTDVVPNLTTQFENAFAVKLTDEAKTIRDVLGQIDARLFQSYTKPAIADLSTIIHNGILAPDWEPPATARPQEVKPYVYETLLYLVFIHAQVSTAAPALTPQILTYLLEQTMRELLQAFWARARFSLPSLVQATLDVEFVSQTLTQFTTDRVVALQSEVYQALDNGTDNDARMRLQGELPAMRTVLKRLREASRSEFACFKKARRPMDRTDS